MADDLFGAAGLGKDINRPLADRLRPARLEDVVGQDHLLGPEGTLTRMIRAKSLSSIVLWGPPGTGKTTIARLLSDAQGLTFVAVSAIFTGVADLKRLFAEAKARRQMGRGTLLFVDEIHRFNRAQQDGFLPHMEDGTIVLVGATTENPSFEINAALLSRAQVLVLKRLDEAALEQLLERAEAAAGKPLPVTPEARASLVAMADGDGRHLLGLAEQLLALAPTSPLDAAALGRTLVRRAPLYDRAREEHYNLISALHKSVRGSDPDAALYWMYRMLNGGEDPLYIARRLIRMAVEDIGLADPTALPLAIAGRDAYEMQGSPEGELALAEVCVHLALAPKSNAVYVAAKAAKAFATDTGSLAPPAHILNAPTRLMRDIGYGKGYEYDHDAEQGVSGQSYFPDEVKDPPAFYTPTARGAETGLADRLKALRSLRAARRQER